MKLRIPDGFRTVIALLETGNGVIVMVNDYVVFRAKESSQVLPFYPRSTGKEILDEGDFSEQKPMDFVEICWIDSGCCKFVLKDTTYQLHAGESLCRMPGELRIEISMAPATVVYWATFDGDNAEHYIRSWGFPRPPLRSGKCPSYLFDAIGRGLLSTSPGQERLLISVYSEVIAMMLKEEKSCSENDSLMEQCLYLINAKLSNPDFNINALADEIGMHRVSIGRLFRKKLGVSPVDYLIGCRIRLGLTLLSRTALPVGEISDRVGLGNANYFCRMIKQHTGMTPMEYRNGRKDLTSAVELRKFGRG